MKSKNSQLFPLLLVLPLAYPHSAVAEEFNMQFVHGQDERNVARQVSQGQEFQPGTYTLDVYLNNQKIDTLPVTFIKQPGSGNVAPCFTAEQLYGYGVLVPAPLDSKQCVDVENIIKQSRVTMSASLQRVSLSVPQSSIKATPRGTVPERLWDSGINAAFVDYNASYTDSVNHMQGGKYSDQYTYISLTNGINIDRWRLRQNASVSHISGDGTHWKNLSSWAETDIPAMRGRLVVGQSATDSSVFDSFQFRGVQLSSVDEMLPDSMRNFAPVVRGVASSNARVTIRQNGYIVYSTNVAPGPFAIRDVYPNTSGDLQVTVTEADGSERHFSVAYSSVTHLLREGIWDYQLTAGRYHNGNSGYSPQFIQGTIARGIAHDLTPYGGMIIAENYQSTVAGIGASLGEFGGVSLDGSYAHTDLASGGSRQGGSFRLLYSKSLNSVGTDFRLAGYRYSTSGYYDFSDAVQERRDWDHGVYAHDYNDPDGLDNAGIPSWAEENNATHYSTRYNNKRSRMELSVSQSLGDYGRLFINANELSYWGESAKSHTLQLGYNSHFKRVSYSVYYQANQTQYHDSDNSINMVLSLPLTWGEDNNNVIVSTTQLTHDHDNGDSYNTGLSGTLLEDNRLTYGVNTGHSRNGGQTSSASMGYQSSIGNLNASYSYSNKYTQKTVDVSGGVVMHAGGVTLAQPLGNAFALVHAPDAQGVPVINAPGVRIDHFGYAVVNNVSPYRYNTVALDTESLTPGLDIPQSVIQTVPTEKAIVGVNFNTYYGHSLLIHSASPDGAFPGIGASVYNAEGRNSGTVGLNGDMYVSGVKSGEVLTIKWGEHENEQCRIAVPANLPPQGKNKGYQELNLLCTTPGQRK